MNESIKSIAIGRENKIISKKLSPEELAKTNEELVENLISLAVHQDKLQEIRAEYKMIMDPIKKEIESGLRRLRNKHIEMEEELYLWDNQDSGMMEYYTEDGELVYSRKLSPGEKQLNLISQGGRSGS